MDPRSDLGARPIPTFLILLFFGFVYQFLLLYDTLAQSNSIQLFFMCLYDAFLCIYTALQWNEVKLAVISLAVTNEIDLNVWFKSKDVLLAISTLTAFFTIATCAISWKLYFEFSWALYKFVRADIRMQRRYQIFQASLISEPSTLARCADESPVVSRTTKF